MFWGLVSQVPILNVEVPDVVCFSFAWYKGVVLSVFSLFPEEIIPYIAVDLVCLWEKVSSESSQVTILNWTFHSCRTSQIDVSHYFKFHTSSSLLYTVSNMVFASVIIYLAIKFLVFLWSFCTLPISLFNSVLLYFNLNQFPPPGFLFLIFR